MCTIGSAFGGIPQNLPTLQLPKLAVSDLLTLIGPAFTIAMLGAIETLLSAVVADGMAGTRNDSNQELIGQGIANIVAPLVGAIARVQVKLERAGIVDLIGAENSFARLDDALAVCRELAEHDPRMAHERQALLNETVEAVEVTAPQDDRRA